MSAGEGRSNYGCLPSLQADLEILTVLCMAFQQQMEYISSSLYKQEGGITEYDEALVRKLIERVTVYDDRLVFEFKSGIKTEVKM